MLIEWMDEREQAQNLDANAQPDEETRITQELIRRVMEQVLADEGVQMETVVGVTLVDPDRIREINNAFRQVDRVTDVLSFPMIGGMLKDATPAELLGCVDPETGALELGDLVICVDRAKEQAAEYGRPQGAGIPVRARAAAPVRIRPRDGRGARADAGARRGRAEQVLFDERRLKSVAKERTLFCEKAFSSAHGCAAHGRKGSGSDFPSA